MKNIQIAIMSVIVLMASHQAQAQYWTTPAPVTLPSIPSGTYNITSYGASTSSANNATAIQNAINAASTAGGGTVQVPSGTFLCGPITLMSKVNLNLASGATLKMLPYGTYPGGSSPADFISGSKLHDVEISGSGTIDGQGSAWWTLVLNGSSVVRPKAMLALSTCTNVLIQGIKMQNAPNAHISFRYTCVNVTVKSFTISTPGTSAPNTDGIDLDANHVYMTGNNIADGDDNIAITGGQYIDIESCTFGVGHGCSIGSFTSSGVSFLTVHGCTFSGTTSGIRMKSERGRGGVVQYLAYNNNTMSGVYWPVFIASYYPSLPGNPTTNASATVTSTTPIWKHIKITNLTATGATVDGVVYGLPEEKVSDVTFNNVKLSGTTGMTIYNATGIVFTNGSTVTVSSGNPVIVYNASVTGITTHAYP